MGLLRNITGVKEASVKIKDNSSLGGVLEGLVEMLPRLRDALGNLEERSPQSILVLLDGIEANNLSGLSTQVFDGSEVVLIPVTHGG